MPKARAASSGCDAGHCAACMDRDGCDQVEGAHALEPRHALLHSGTPRRFSVLAADPHHVIALEMPSRCRLSGLKASLHSCLGTLARLSLRSSAGPHRPFTAPLRRRDRFSAFHADGQPWSPAGRCVRTLSLSPINLKPVSELIPVLQAVTGCPQILSGAAADPAADDGTPQSSERQPRTRCQSPFA